MSPTESSPPASNPFGTANYLHELLDGPADEVVVMVADGRPVSYGWLRRRVTSLVGGLRTYGLAQGDRLAIWLPNSPDWIALALACSRLGVGVVSLNMRWGPKEVGDMVERTGCKGIVLSSAYRGGACVDGLRAIPSDKLRSLSLVVTDDASPVLPGIVRATLAVLAAHEAYLSVDGTPQDEAFIVATSGTTSLPKLVVHLQRSVCRHAGDVARSAGLFESNSRMLLAVPLCGAYGYTVGMASLAARCPLVMMEAFEPAAAADLIDAHAVTHMMGTNDMLDKLLDSVPGQRPFPGLRLFGYANFVPSLSGVPEEAESRGVLIRGFYSMSELLAGFAAQPAEAPLAQRAHGGGFPVCAEAEVAIRHPETGVAVPTGETGELVVKTPNRMQGYLDNPRATAAAMTGDGYFRTGDLAYRLPDGAFVFVSRMVDVLRVGGYLVSPAEIEDMLAADAAVQAAQVVSVSLAQGERPVAFVIVRPGQALDEAALLRRCREQLAIYKVPVRIFEIDALPMIEGPNGSKLDRNALRRRAQALLDAEAEKR